jgi:hypothetical protein
VTLCASPNPLRSAMVSQWACRARGVVSIDRAWLPVAVIALLLAGCARYAQAQ